MRLDFLPSLLIFFFDFFISVESGTTFALTFANTIFSQCPLWLSVFTRSFSEELPGFYFSSYILLPLEKMPPLVVDDKNQFCAIKGVKPTHVEIERHTFHQSSQG